VEELILPVVRAHPGDARLAGEATLLRDAARARRTVALQGAAHHRVFADLLAYLHCEWRGETEDPPPRLEDFAVQRLEWLHRKVEKAAKGASAEDVPTLHRLRIAIKRLGYSLEFFAPLFPEADVRRYRNRMKSLQEDLGRLNDLANAYPRLADRAW
jgi:CHAD domain-containing protein